MAKDPNYDRYAGIVSLPGADGKMPRPFRVDEDGNVIYRDAEAAAKRFGDRQSREAARAGILDWDELDRRLDMRSASPTQDIVATGARPFAAGGSRGQVATTRKTFGGIDYHVISANSYDPTRSNGKTILPDEDTIAAMKAGKWQTAVTDRGPERATRIVRLPLDFSARPDSGPVSERNLPLTNTKAEMYYSVPAVDAKAKSVGDADTLRFSALPGTVAFGHGHRDGISDDMIDDWNPSKGLYGDIESLRAADPMPMATISEGRIGWHQMENGRLQFMYPVGSYSDKEKQKEYHMRQRIQENLDRQQSLFHRKD